ncbi:unnamed protein product [Owenia fusiformis]|uniref:Uncharacterized protein n=1 Tax=Owenia fusiformis TaxID=6347 RepID=A0A8J1TZF5_OWEFU|nr:unnamed protein product [Owenia fusiformis]
MAQASSSTYTSNLDEHEERVAKELCALTAEVFRDHEKEAMKIIELGNIYKERCKKETNDREVYVHAVALYNGAKACLNAVPNNLSKYDMYTKKIKAACDEINNLYLSNIVNGSTAPPYKKLKRDEGHETEPKLNNDKKEITDFRKKLKGGMNKVVEVWDRCPKPNTGKNPKYKNELNDATKSICQDNTNFVKKFSSGIMERCISVCGPPPCRFTMVGLGSLARGESTPYSDLEYLFLTADDRYDEYFLNLHFYFQMQVLNLGETPLPAVGINSLNDFYNPHVSNNFYDDVTPSGFKLDGNMPWACKIPPGHKGTIRKEPLKLIGTPKYMAELSTTEADKKHGYHLATIISTATRIMGDEELFNTFRDLLLTVRGSENAEHMYEACLERLKEDCKKYEFTIDNLSVLSRNAKKDYYRFPSILVNNLKDIYGIQKTSPWDIIDELQAHMSSDSCSDLLFMVNIVIGLRLYTYCMKNQQHELVIASHDLFPKDLPSAQDRMSKSESVSREALPIPFTNLLENYFLRYMSSSVSVSARLEEPIQKSLDGSPLLMKSCPLYCDCKYCLLRVKILTAYVAKDDIIDDPDVVLASAQNTWHHKIKPITRKNVVIDIAVCFYTKGDNVSRLQVLKNELQNNKDLSQALKARYTYMIARCHLDLKEYPPALENIDAAIAEYPKERLLAPMIIKLDILCNMEEYEKLISCSQECLRLQTDPECKPWVDKSTDTLWIYFYYTPALIHFKEYEKALDYLIKAKPLCIEVVGETHWRTKTILERMATCYTALGQHEQASLMKDMM